MRDGGADDSDGKVVRPHDQLCVIDNFSHFVRQIAKYPVGCGIKGRWAFLKRYLNREAVCVVRLANRAGEKFDLVYAAIGPGREFDDPLVPRAADCDGADRQLYIRQCPVVIVVPCFKAC